MHSFTVLSALAGASLVFAKPLAAPAPAPVVTPAPNPHLAKLALERRAPKTTSSESECESKADALWEETSSLGLEFDDALARWFQSRAEAADSETATVQDVNGICSVQYVAASDVPASLSSAYSAFTSASASWVSKARPTVQSVADLCGGVTSAGLEVMLATDFDSCTSLYGLYMSAALASLSSDDATGAATVSSTGVHKPAATATTGGAKPTGTVTSASGTSSSTGAAGASAASSSLSTGAAPRETGFAVAAAAAVMALAGAVVAL